MVFQSYALYPQHERANMAFSLRMKKLSEQEIERRVDNAASILGIETLLDRKPKTLSGVTCPHSLYQSFGRSPVVGDLRSCQ